MIKSERTTSSWYDNLLDGTVPQLESEIESCLAHPEQYQAWQFTTLADMARVNGLHEHFETLRDLRNAASEADRHATAEKAVSTKALLTKRLKSACQILVGSMRPHFSKCNVDVANNRLVSDNGKFALQWENRDTTIGCVCIRIIKEQKVA